MTFSIIWAAGAIEAALNIFCCLSHNLFQLCLYQRYLFEFNFWFRLCWRFADCISKISQLLSDHISIVISIENFTFELMISHTIILQFFHHLALSCHLLLIFSGASLSFRQLILPFLPELFLIEAYQHRLDLILSQLFQLLLKFWLSQSLSAWKLEVFDFVIYIFEFYWLSIVLFVVAEVGVEMKGVLDQWSSTEYHAWVRIPAFCWLLLLLFAAVWASVAHILKLRIRTILHSWLCGLSQETIGNRVGMFTLWHRDLWNLQREWVVMDAPMPAQPTRHPKRSTIILLYTSACIRRALIDSLSMAPPFLLDFGGHDLLIIPASVSE